MLEGDEVKSLGISTGLILANIILMAVIGVSPLSQILSLLFGIPIIGVIVFGGMITGGYYLAKKGVNKNKQGLAFAGTGILQVAYGLFGGGVISILPARLYPVVLAVTAIISTVIAVISGLIVYSTDHDFSKWGMYSNFIFGGVFISALLGSFGAFSPLLILAFILALVGFIVYLIYEIWEMKSRPSNVIMNAIGLYVAYMGVFVEILQIVVRSYMEE